MYEILKKKFSQNFLVDKNIIYKICSEIKYENLNILEIGPGDGRLTETIFKFKPKKSGYLFSKTSTTRKLCKLCSNPPCASKRRFNERSPQCPKGGCPKS